MYCSQLLMLSDILSRNEIDAVDSFFSNLTVNEARCITVSKLRDNLSFSEQQAMKTMIRCVEVGILDIKYALQCDECEMFIKIYDNIQEVPFDTMVQCYACDVEIKVTKDSIVLLFELKNNFYPFVMGQHDASVFSSRITVAQLDSLASIASSMSDFVFFLNAQDSNKKEEEKKNDEISKRAIKIHRRNRFIQGIINVIMILIIARFLCFIFFIYQDSDEVDQILTISTFVLSLLLNGIIEKIICTDYELIKEKVRLKY